MDEIKRISILIPVFNEEKTLADVLDKVHAVSFGEVEKEIVLVDDGSSDSTWEMLKSASAQSNVVISQHTVNQGKGAAIQTALKLSTGDVVIIQDADLEYVPEDIPRLLETMGREGTNVVYGSRMQLTSNKKYSLLYYYGNRFLNLCVLVIYGKWVSDMETCYKMMRRELMLSLKIESNRFDMEPEITGKLLRLKERIAVVPIRYLPRSRLEGKKITWKDGVVALWTLLKWRFQKLP